MCAISLSGLRSPRHCKWWRYFQVNRMALTSIFRSQRSVLAHNNIQFIVNIHCILIHTTNYNEKTSSLSSSSSSYLYWKIKQYKYVKALIKCARVFRYVCLSATAVTAYTYICIPIHYNTYSIAVLSFVPRRAEFIILYIQSRSYCMYYILSFFLHRKTTSFVHSIWILSIYVYYIITYRVLCAVLGEASGHYIKRVFGGWNQVVTVNKWPPYAVDNW